MNHLEQRYAIKFCVKLNKSPSETVQLLSEAYPTDRLSKTQIYEWHKRFRDGRENVESELGQGRTATSTTQENIIAVENLLNENPRLTVRKIAGTLGISLGSCHSMLHEQLGMSRVCSRWVPRLLTNQMKVDRVTKAQEILDRYFHEGEAFLKRIVTGDEVWLHYYDPETKQQSSEWKRPTEPTPLKPRATKSAGKIMAVFFSTARESFIDTLFPVELPLQGICTLKYWRIYVMLSIRNGHIFEISAGCCITTMHPPTPPERSWNFYIETTLKLSRILLILQIWPPATSFIFQT